MKKVINAILVLILVSVCSAGIYAQCTSTIYVKRNANGTNDGSSWVNAHRSIQAALDQAEACATIREIWVAEGIYKPTVDVAGSTTISLTANRTLVIDFNVRLYGGFGGYETSPKQRIKHLFPTILSGDQNDDDIYETNINSALFPLSNSLDNSYNIMRLKNLSTSTIIDGFIFEGGDADNSSTLSKRLGAAIFNDGRGLNDESNPIISNCIFRHNRSNEGGGAVYNYGENSDASPFFLGCEFNYNLTKRNGGGAIANFAKGFNAKSNPQIESCLFNSNVGGTLNVGSDIHSGGAILNISESFGKSEPIVKNCTIVNNVSEFGGGISSTNNSDFGTIGTESTTTIVNSILDNNSTLQDDNIHDIQTITNISYSIFPEIVTYPGMGNMDVDPKFVSATNFRLLDTSPAIDAGKPTTGGFGGGAAYDIDNNARSIGVRGDIGTYEFLTCPVSNAIYVNETQYDNSPSGESIFTGLNSLTMGLEMAKNCSGTPHILISEGTYYPHRSSELLPLQGAERRGANFLIERNMRITGSQPASLLSLSAPGPSYLTGDMYRDDNFATESKLENVYNVMEIKGDVTEVILERMEVERGCSFGALVPKAPGLHIDTLNVDSLLLVVKECNFRRHASFFNDVGTIDIDLTRGDYDLNAKFINTQLTTNFSEEGAAIRIYNDDSKSKLFLDSCQIQGNDTFGNSGPITYRTNSTLADDIHIREGDVQENDGATAGGALSFYFNGSASGDVIIENSKIQDNQGSIGGAIFYQGSEFSNFVIKRSAIYSNDALTSSGGLHIEGGDVAIHNSIFRGNEVTSDGSSGGAIQIDKDGGLISINNTFINNEAEVAGGAIYSKHPTATASIINSIFWNNTADGVLNTLDFSATSNQLFNLDYSLIPESSCPVDVVCTNMIYNQDPLIEGNIGSLNYTPGSGSPAINAGDRVELPNELTDYTGVNYRVVNYKIDMGAYEVQQDCVSNRFLNVGGVPQDLVGGWSSSNKITVGSGNKTTVNGWLILDSPTVEFLSDYEFSSGETLQVFTHGCTSN